MTVVPLSLLWHSEGSGYHYEMGEVTGKQSFPSLQKLRNFSLSRSLARLLARALTVDRDIRLY
jgi:hypothetical protein